MSIETLHARIDKLWPKHLEETRRMLRIPSVSMTGEGIQETAEALSELLSGMGAKVGAAFGIFLTRLTRALLFLGMTTAIYFVLAEDEQRDRTVFVFYLSAIAIIRFVAAAAYSYYSPAHTAIRIPLFADAGASRLYWTIMGSVVFGAFGFFTDQVMNQAGDLAIISNFKHNLRTDPWTSGIDIRTK